VAGATRRIARSVQTIVRGRTLVTGFGPFLQVVDNPSSLLARECRRPHELLEVSYDGVRSFLRRLNASQFDRLLLVGVCGGDDQCRLETLGRNHCGTTPDVRGHVPEVPESWEEGPSNLPSTLGGRSLPPIEGLRRSDHAGDYLCNFTLYEALRRFPDKQVGFLHVPSPDRMPLEEQLRVLEQILMAIEE
jgi:pyrrolidone-carboxylate peptidase